MFFKYGVPGVIREDQGDGHKSGGRIKRLYSRILRKKLYEETREIIDDQETDDEKTE